MGKQMEILREKILAFYGLDIEQASSHFSTQNYAFTFRESPYMVRVSIGSSKSREEALSEVMWVDDLKLFGESICEPSPSKNDHLIEEFEIDGETYRTAMFRTAKGKTKDVQDADPMYFIAVGDLLGRIHAASEDVNRKGLHYQRPDWDKKREEKLEKAQKSLKPEIMNKVMATMKEIQKIPRTADCYGMIHGDFHSHNFFVDGNNVWVFDFDDCCYGYFMYDIAAACSAWLTHAYSPKKTRREALYEDILPYFKIGYELHKKLPEEYWDKLELFICDRQCVTAIALAQIEKSGIISNLEEAREQVCIPLYSDGILEGLDYLLSQNKGIKLNDAKVKDSNADFIYQEAGNAEEKVIAVHGRLLVEEAPELDRQIKAALAAGTQKLTLDFADLSYISSAGIRVILKAYQNVNCFSIIHAKPTVKEVIEMVGLGELLKNEA